MSELSKENELVSLPHKWVCPVCGKVYVSKKMAFHYCVKAHTFVDTVDDGLARMNWLCRHGFHIYHCTGTGWQDSWSGTGYQTCNSRECYFCHKSQHAKSVTISGQGLYGYRGWEDDE